MNTRISYSPTTFGDDVSSASTSSTGCLYKQQVSGLMQAIHDSLYENGNSTPEPDRIKNFYSVSKLTCYTVRESKISCFVLSLPEQSGCSGSLKILLCSYLIITILKCNGILEYLL